MSRFLVFCFFILIATPSSAQSQQDCSRSFSGKIFSKSVVHSIKWQVFRHIKRLRGFLPHNKEAIVKAIKESMLKDLRVQAFAQQLSHLSQRTPTSILFFSPEKNSHCVWLFSSTGEVYAGTTKPWKTFTLQRAFSRLDVSMTGLSQVRSARQTRTGKCLKPQTQSIQKSRSPSEMDFRLLRVNRALKKLRNSLIPPNIFAQLLTTKDSRLIIIPAKGRGMVPFSALPLRDGHFIDKFSILLTPAITDLIKKQDWVIDQAAFTRKLTSRLISKYGRHHNRSLARRRAATARWLAARRRADIARRAIARRRTASIARQRNRLWQIHQREKKQVLKAVLALQNYLKEPKIQKSSYMIARLKNYQKHLDGIIGSYNPALNKKASWSTHTRWLQTHYRSLRAEQRKNAHNHSVRPSLRVRDSRFILEKLDSIRKHYRPVPRRTRPRLTLPHPPAEKKAPPPDIKKPVGTVLFIPPPGRKPLFVSRNNRTDSGRHRAQANNNTHRMIMLPVTNPLRSLAKRGDNIIVGNPDLTYDKNYCWNDLPFAKSEAEYVASQFKNSTLFTGNQASFQNVYNALKQKQKSARYIYLATHGVSDSINPADGSFLALSQKHLTGASLRKLKFHNNPLVVLSACQTGLGKVFPGGMFGLAQAWYYAGAQKTVMTLWNVSDEATATLMKIFNRNLARRNSGQVDVSSAEFALGNAIRQFKKDNPDPVYWAGISIYGTPSE